MRKRKAKVTAGMKEKHNALKGRLAEALVSSAEILSKLRVVSTCIRLLTPKRSLKEGVYGGRARAAFRTSAYVLCSVKSQAPRACVEL
ncbi:hypothetical protein EVAR_30951_1 [Eumeta japonica]|uniref:Uncharacterized protein n=1 Tax=Eumeta variegata TaxID=151549 RepID=A0A4C1V3K5_EUMVA|nr:hypothetical protein EVAR_30951_1 [Eumeta japonica]